MILQGDDSGHNGQPSVNVSHCIIEGIFVCVAPEPELAQVTHDWPCHSHVTTHTHREFQLCVQCCPFQQKYNKILKLTDCNSNPRQYLIYALLSI